MHRYHFRFENCWLTDPTLQLTVKQAWCVRLPPVTGQNNLLPTKLHTVTESLHNLKRRFTPTHIKTNIKNLEQELLSVQHLPLSKNTLSREASLQLQLEDLRNIENAYWKQRAKTHWLTDSDRNTKFFHTQTYMRNSKNTILGIYNNTNDWVTTNSDIKYVFLSHYKGLFAPPHCLPCPFSFWGFNPIPLEINNDTLTAILTQ